MRKVEHGFYFGLPRLVAHWRGRASARTEMNGLEARVAGAIVHGVVYLCAAHFLLAGLPLWLQVALLLPLLLLVWLLWIVVLFLNFLLLRFLRAKGLLESNSEGRAQSFLVGTFTTLCALALLASDSLLAAIGVAWLILLLLNLGADALIAIDHGSSRI